MAPIRTLFVSPQVPWPLDVGSKLRIFNLIRSYADVGSVTLVCISQSDSDASDAVALGPYVGSTHLVSVDMKRSERGIVSSIRRVLNPDPRAVLAFQSKAMQLLVSDLLRRERYDVVHIERLAMVRNVSDLQCNREPYWVLDLDDLESRKAWRQANLKGRSMRKRLLDLIDAVKLRAYESRHLKRFSRVLVCAEADSELLRRRGLVTQATTFENGSDAAELSRASAVPDGSAQLLFLGAMDYGPNEDAVLFFVREVFPLINERFPQASLTIAGKSPSSAVAALANRGSIEVTGYVENKWECYARCAVFVAPIRTGGGTRIKIIEAMAAGKAVVSTTIGCEGIDVTPNRNILIADTPKEFAEACLRLLNDVSLRTEIGREARLASGKYEWRMIRRAYAQKVSSAVTSRRSEGASERRGRE